MMRERSKLKAGIKMINPKTIYLLYWFVVTYIVAMLIWWFIALNNQNKLMAGFKLQHLQQTDKEYTQKLEKIKNDEYRKKNQFIGEGSTFFLLIAAGAFLVFRALRSQFRQAHEQQNFMIAVTHELKTPIAITKLNLETLKKFKLEEQKQQSIINNTIQEVNRLNALCNNMLLTSQIEAGGYRSVTEEINLSDLVTSSIADFKQRFSDRNFITAVPPQVFISGDLLLLQMAVNNLIDNAIKYSNKNSSVFVDLHLTQTKINISVKDEGKGIPDDEKLKVFKKYYRLGNAYTKGAKGTGLGLYLTKKIVTRHQGNIIVLNNHPQGSIFEITFNKNA